jgi:membrane fusion protein, multidrug efflux system
MRLSYTFVVLGVAITSAAAVACSRGAASSSTTPAGGGRGGAGAPVPVTVGTVVQKPMPIEVKVIGSAEPHSTVVVRAQVTGQLISVNFREGDDVKKGQILFELDRRPLEAALLQAQANLARDTAQLTNAEAQAKRFQDLAERGIATKEQLDTSRTGVAALTATVEADRAAVENAQVQLQYATITAPLSGRTGTLMVHEGNLVRANDTTSLVVINEVSPIYVSFAIPEGRLSDLKRYMAQGSLRVEASPPEEGSSTSNGRITFVDNAVDPTTGTIKIKAEFANGDRRLWPGQFVNVSVLLATDTAAIVAPSPAIQTSQQGPYAFVVKEDKTVEFRVVEVARASATETVIKNGLQAGETVVTDGHLRLVPGAHISVKGDENQKVTP